MDVASDKCLLCEEELEETQDPDLVAPLTVCCECWYKLVILAPREVWETVH